MWGEGLEGGGTRPHSKLMNYDHFFTPSPNAFIPELPGRVVAKIFIAVGLTALVRGGDWDVIMCISVIFGQVEIEAAFA